MIHVHAIRTDADNKVLAVFCHASLAARSVKLTHHKIEGVTFDETVPAKITVSAPGREDETFRITTHTAWDPTISAMHVYDRPEHL